MRELTARLARCCVMLALAAPSRSTHSETTPLAIPTNDDCAGALIIPAVPFTTPPVDITNATPQEADDGFHLCTAGGADRTVWYRFTPNESGAYLITTCPAPSMAWAM